MNRSLLLTFAIFTACTTATTASTTPPNTSTTSSITSTSSTTSLTTTTAVAPTTTHTHPARVRGEGMEGAAAQKLAAIAACESGGRYDAVSPSGKHRGAHQWDRRTWDGVARRHRPDLEGHDPAGASPGDQEAMAAHLYAERGSQPWPACGRRG